MIPALLGSDRLSWRRLAVFVVATALLLAGYLEADAWLIVAGIFVGGDALERAVRSYKPVGLELPAEMLGNLSAFMARIAREPEEDKEPEPPAQ